jgi:hypothetical protein
MINRTLYFNVAVAVPLPPDSYVTQNSVFRDLELIQTSLLNSHHHSVGDHLIDHFLLIVFILYTVDGARESKKKCFTAHNKLVLCVGRSMYMFHFIYLLTMCLFYLPYH